MSPKMTSRDPDSASSGHTDARVWGCAPRPGRAVPLDGRTGRESGDLAVLGHIASERTTHPPADLGFLVATNGSRRSQPGSQTMLNKQGTAIFVCGLGLKSSCYFFCVSRTYAMTILI
jgi:hypothetical protein